MWVESIVCNISVVFGTQCNIIRISFLGGIAESIQPYRLLRQMLPYSGLSVCVSVCPSVTFMHPAKAVGRNDMPFGSDTPVVPRNIVLYRGPGPPSESGDRNPVKICIANCGQTVKDSGIQ